MKLKKKHKYLIIAIAVTLVLCVIAFFAFFNNKNPLASFDKADFCEKIKDKEYTRYIADCGQISTDTNEVTICRYDNYYNRFRKTNGKNGAFWYESYEDNYNSRDIEKNYNECLKINSMKKCSDIKNENLETIPNVEYYVSKYEKNNKKYFITDGKYEKYTTIGKMKLVKRNWFRINCDDDKNAK